MGIQGKHKVIMDSLPHENLQGRRARLVGLRNKASMVGRGEGGRDDVRDSRVLTPPCWGRASYEY